MLESHCVVRGHIGCAAPLEARVTRIDIDDKVSPAFCKGSACASYGETPGSLKPDWYFECLVRGSIF